MAQIMAEPWPIPESAFSERFLAASGPGGQNVNKVATACQLRVDVFALGLAPDVWQRLKTVAGSRLTSAGELVITAQRFRTQEANRADARARAGLLIARALERPRKRIATKAGKAAKARRVDDKKARSSIKAGRGRVTPD
jgi:ribosome-associated protein